MSSLSDISHVKVLQGHLRTTLESPDGKEIMSFLEELCGWYDFSELDTNTIMIKHGKRQVLATIKTLLKLKPEEIVALDNKEN